MGGREGKKTGSAVSLVGSSSLRRGESYETVLQIHAGASHFFGRAFTLERASTPRCGALALLRAFVPGLSCERTVRSLEEFYKIPSSTNFHFVSIKKEREREKRHFLRK